MNGSGWTLAIYLAADNDLESAALADLDELASVGAGPNVDVVVQVDRAFGHDESAGDWTETRRLRLGVAAGGPGRWAPLGAPLGETNSGDPDVVAGFFSAALPRDGRRAAIIWGHGTGADTAEALIVRGGLAARRRLFSQTAADALDVRAVLLDDFSGDCLDTVELGRVLAVAAAGRPLELVGLDACLMSTLEVAAELAPHAAVMVASIAVEPEDGWAYGPVLAALHADPQLDGGGLGRVIAELYAAPDPKHRTVAVLDLAAVPSAVAAFAEVVEAIEALGASGDELLVAVRAGIRGFGEDGRFDHQVDLGTLAHKLGVAAAALARGADAPAAALALKAACTGLSAALATLVLQVSPPTRPSTRAVGVAVHFPRSAPPTAPYADLTMCARTGWHRVLARLGGQP